MEKHMPNAVRNFSPVGWASFVTKDVHAKESGTRKKKARDAASHATTRQA